MAIPGSCSKYVTLLLRPYHSRRVSFQKRFYLSNGMKGHTFSVPPEFCILLHYTTGKNTPPPPGLAGVSVFLDRVAGGGYCGAINGVRCSDLQNRVPNSSSVIGSAFPASPVTGICPARFASPVYSAFHTTLTTFLVHGKLPEASVTGPAHSACQYLPVHQLIHIVHQPLRIVKYRWHFQKARHRIRR